MSSGEVHLVGSDDERVDLLDMPDQIVLRSVGIDIGSATSHLVISQIVLRRLGKALLSRYAVIDRSVLFESPILLTPYRSDGLIDAESLRDEFHDFFAAAGFATNDVDTGAVILTGEAMRRANAQAIGEMFEDNAGRFVCATAGDLYEVTMAAHGSGSVQLSREQQKRVLNIDIGGGTTKISISEAGQIVERGVLHVGARLIATDSESRIIRQEKAIEPVLRDLGISAGINNALSVEEKREIAAALVDSVEEFLGLKAVSDVTRTLAITDTLKVTDIQEVVFSSGVSEYVYGREDRDFGDLAPAIAHEIRQRISTKSWPWVVHEVTTGIRATVAGLSQYSIQMSGDTIFASHVKDLPWRNLPLVHVSVEDIRNVGVSAAMQSAFTSMDFVEKPNRLAWYLDVPDSRNYSVLRNFSEDIVVGLDKTVGMNSSNVFVFSQDIAGTIGHILVDELRLSQRTIVLDCINIDGVDFLDVGEVVEPNSVVPVAVKSLVY